MRWRVANLKKLEFEDKKLTNPTEIAEGFNKFFAEIGPTPHRTEFHQNRKDPIWEIQLLPNLGHNLCENDKQTLHDYI